jgi:hypothetical protein
LLIMPLLILGGPSPTWPWTVRRILQATVLPDEILSIIARLAFVRARSAHLIRQVQRRLRKQAARCTHGFRLYTEVTRAMRGQLLCDSFGVFFGKRFVAKGEFVADCCSTTASDGAFYCGRCGVVTCAACWHRLLHQRCVCARGHGAGGGIYDGAHERILKYWRRGQ